MLILEAHQLKYYHLGFGSTVSRRNFGTANEKRNYRIVEEFAYVLIEETLELISDGYLSSATLNTWNECWEMINHPTDNFSDIYSDADTGL
jgi:hypothetical protein